MEFEEFHERVSQAKSAHPVWFGLEADPVGTDADIETVERLLSITLPDEYRKFVKRFGGGYFAFTNVYSVIRGSEWDMVSKNQSIGLIDSHHFLAISDQQTGDYFGYKIVKGICESTVSVFDHDSRRIEATKYGDLFEYLLEMGLNNFE